MSLLGGSWPGLSASLHVFCLSVAPQTLAGQTFLEMKQRVISTCCTIATVWRMLENFPVELYRVIEKDGRDLKPL